MGKRINEAGSDPEQVKAKQFQASESMETGSERGSESEGMGEFEDPYGDEMDVDGEEEEGSGCEDEVIENKEDSEEDPAVEVYLPGRNLEEGEQLEVDNSAYDMLHTMTIDWPCLSFDIIPDPLGENRTKYPMTSYIVAGTQADVSSKNSVMIMKLSQLCKTKHDDDAAPEEESDDEDVDGDPILEHRSLPHLGGVNRIRVHAPQPDITLASTWSDTGKVYIYDLQPHLNAIDNPGHAAPTSKQPIHVVETHGQHEGFAMDWSTLHPGKLLTGDIAKRIYLTTVTNTGVVPDRLPFTGHQSSVEDLQWSPSEKNVFASCSADGTVRIWDIRNKKKPALGINAHQADVNVISWNKPVNYLLASGSDDGSFAVWDLRTFSSNNSPAPVAAFKWHTAPITSIEWHPTEESVLGVAGADDQISLWDLSVEPDSEDPAHSTLTKTNGTEVPPQLLFVHQGQSDIKELHWHRQIPGCVISTSFSGFNIFKTISI